MQVIVKNFRGISEAQIEVSPVALLCGLNGAGKTSMARAIAAAASGKAVPCAKVTKKDCGVMLRHGSKAGMVAISTGQGTTTIDWPKAEVHTDGLPLVASEIATGLTDLFSMKEDAALGYLIDLLKAKPDLEDIKAAFIGPDSTEEEIATWAKIAEKIWKVIEAQDWLAAHKQASETGVKLKGAWQQVAGTAYGKEKAKSWFLDGWNDSLIDQTPESFEAKIAEAKAELEQAIGDNAISRAEQDRLKLLADQLPLLEAQLAEAQTAKELAESSLRAAEEKIKGIPNPDGKKSHECPHCRGELHVSAISGNDFVLTKAEKVPESKLKDARLEYAGLCGERTRLAGDVQARRQAVSDAIRKRDEAVNAKEKLDGLGEVANGDTEAALATARAKVDTLQRELNALNRYTEARRIDGQIAQNQLIIDALDESGIRKKKLSQFLSAFCGSYVVPLCASLGMPAVSIDTDLNVKMGNTPYPMVSASEQFRVRTVLQIAIAQLEQSSLIIIDGADILDKDGRSKLLNLVVRSGIPAVICMTLNRPDMAPDLAAAGVGVTYWVENGTCSKRLANKAA